MENNVKISMLLDIYGNLLTDKQKQLLDDYYNNDLSLSEIAENEHITRQAVRDNLKKGEKNLLEYEKKLNVMQKNLKQKDTINFILEKIYNIEFKLNEKSKFSNEQYENDIKEYIKQIKEELTKLI